MDGLDVTRAIRAQEGAGERRTPIIAVTADAQSGDRDRCLAAGMDAYLTKPLALDDLRRALATWLRWPLDEDRAAAEPATGGALDVLSRELGSAAAAGEIVVLWLDELPGRRAAVCAAIAADDAAATLEAAHLLASTCALLGAGATSDTARAIEAAAGAGDVGAAAQRLGDLERGLDELERELRSWLAAEGIALSES
jgi:HPt (histidine-containing phosphotransfer) domain-containing protein